MDDGTEVNCFIALLNEKLEMKIKEETIVTVYFMLLNDKLNPDWTIDDGNLMEVESDFAF